MVGGFGRIGSSIKKVGGEATASGCKPDALCISYFLVVQAHFPVRLPCYDLPHLVVYVGYYIFCYVVLRRVTGGVYMFQGYI